MNRRGEGLLRPTLPTPPHSDAAQPTQMQFAPHSPPCPTQMQRDPSYLLDGLRPLPLPAADRAACVSALASVLKRKPRGGGGGGSEGSSSSGGGGGGSSNPLLYSLLLAGGCVVAAASAKGAPALDSLDVLVLCNFVLSTPGLRGDAGDVFCPVSEGRARLCVLRGAKGGGRRQGRAAMRAKCAAR
eukprot:336866-Chlamydomonas_euryale.AAC.1